MSGIITSTPGFGKGFVSDPKKWVREMRALSESITLMTAEERFRAVDGGVYMAPSWGTAAMRLRQTPVFLYDRPELEKIIGPSMSTDGVNIFVNLNFLKQLVDCREENNSYGTEAVLCHEISHMLMNHIQRIDAIDAVGAQYTDREKNIAADIEINIPIYDDFNDKYPIGPFVLGGWWWGSKDGEVDESYRGKTFEELLRERKQASQQQPQGKDGQDQGGVGMPGGQGGDQDPGQGNSPGNGQMNDMDDIHTVEDLIKKISDLSEEIGDPSLMDSLVNAGIIKPGDAGKIKESMAQNGELPDDVKQRAKKISDLARSASRQAIQKGQEMAKNIEGGMPGGHMLDTMVSRIRSDEEVDINYQTVLERKVKAIGEHKIADVNKMNGLCYLRHGDLGLKKRMPYLPGRSMAKETVRLAAVVDTSSSMSDQRDLPESLGSLMKLVKEHNAEVYIYSGDTVVRHYPTLLNKALLEKVEKEGAEFLGRGGTNIEHVLRQVMARNHNEDMKNAIDISNGSSGKKARSGLGGGGFGQVTLGSGLKNNEHDFDMFIYISDFEDSIPNPEQFSREEIRKTVFLATSRVGQRAIRGYRDMGWAAYGIGKGEDVKLSSGKGVKP